MNLEIKAVQRALVNHRGAPLKVDGNAGPETLWAMAAAQLPVERQMALRRAQRVFGLVEDLGPNRDALGIIADYLAECGVKVPAPYCAAAVSCWLAIPGVRQASAQALGRTFPRTVDPVAGDVCWFPTGAWEGHIELTLGANELEVMTIGANVDNQIRVLRRPKAGLNFGRTPFPLPEVGTEPGVIVKGVPLYTRPGQTR